MTTDAETSCIIHIKSVHNHEADDRKLERQELRINAKRKGRLFQLSLMGT